MTPAIRGACAARLAGASASGRGDLGRVPATLCWPAPGRTRSARLATALGAGPRVCRRTAGQPFDQKSQWEAVMNPTDLIDSQSLRFELPEFAPGDKVRVHVRVVEGDRSRVQVFEGHVIGRRGSGVRETFTVRKVSFGIGVERTFPVHAPTIERLERVSEGRVRRAKLYYLRDRVGKGAKVKEKQSFD